MLKLLRQTITQALWLTYRDRISYLPRIEKKLAEEGMYFLPLDHFAIIDLPGKNTGIPHLAAIFLALGYEIRGKDYLAEKQNAFQWMSEAQCEEQIATEVLPQVVTADFNLSAMPAPIQKIILHYTNQAPPSPLVELQYLLKQAANNPAVTLKILALMTAYFSGPDWPLPTVQDFQTVLAFNELLAWVLVFGRRPNHFALSIHHLPMFADLSAFNTFIETELQIPLNQENGVIKGNAESKVAQSSTESALQPIHLRNGTVFLPTEFIEFIWRFPLKPNPKKHKDFFTGFIGSQANTVIESLYE